MTLADKMEKAWQAFWMEQTSGQEQKFVGIEPYLKAALNWGYQACASQQEGQNDDELDMLIMRLTALMIFEKKKETPHPNAHPLSQTSNIIQAAITRLKER